ncbi:hypothetical protein SAMN05192534_12264 [Alteribacillus persepolensis]|uniref:Uncharacterized protein n=1 Tax=Alteribacillus persepolensis TaxID=568899 RepID=A0A1G8I244_9BACI|nr:hypothetical protein SAMN05192534_12264 [Alteribacillus persepolensis]
MMDFAVYALVDGSQEREVPVGKAAVENPGGDVFLMNGSIACTSRSARKKEGH